MVLSFTPRFKSHQRSNTSFTESAFTSVLIPSYRNLEVIHNKNHRLSAVVFHFI